MAEAQIAWSQGQFNDMTKTVMEIAATNIAAVENVKFATRLIQMDYEDYRTAMEKE